MTTRNGRNFKIDSSTEHILSKPLDQVTHMHAVVINVIKYVHLSQFIVNRVVYQLKLNVKTSQDQYS